MIKVIDTNIKEVKIIEPNIFTDNRGHFFENIRCGQFLDGDWDNPVGPKFEDLIEYVSIRDHIFGNCQWRHSDFAKRIVRYMQNNGVVRGGYTDINDFLNDRTVQINELVSSIKRHGVLPAADGIRKSVLDDISVNLGRNGEILFNNRGHHRLSIAKILGINTVPVQVVVVHASLSNGS